VFNQFAIRDREVVGVFVRFSCAASTATTEQTAATGGSKTAPATSVLHEQQ
jgi:hypothetical protein